MMVHKYIWLFYCLLIYQPAHAMPDSCAKINGMYVTAVTHSTALIRWDPSPATVVGYHYVVNQQQVPPDKYGLFTKDTFYMAKGLASGATYYAHVRTACQNGQSSKWVTVQFNTPAPPRPDDGSDKVFAVTVYPAQAERSVTIKAKGVLAETASLRLQDIRGKVLSDYTLTGDRLSIEVSSLPSSIYFIRYIDEYGRLLILRFTKMEKINTANMLLGD